MVAPRSVTIVIPTCERIELLRRTAEGALAQRDVDVELVIVNDGARPLPRDLAKSAHAPVRVIDLSEHRGVAWARNAGIEVAEGEWIALLDDDDLWSPDKLAIQLSACDDQAAAWSYGAGVYVDERLIPFQALPAPGAQGLLERLYRHQVIPGACSNVLVRAGVLRELGGFDPQLHQLADWDLCLRLAERSRAAPVNDVLLAYVQHGGSMLITEPASIFREYDRFLAKHRASARQHDYSLDPESFAFWTVNRLERAGQRRRAAGESLRAALHYREASLALNAARIAVAGGRRHTSADAGRAAPQWLKRYPAALVG
jgi:glycosyltransferase involved in cell wall biosynthesis